MEAVHETNANLAVEDYTAGIPRLAALHDSNDSFSIYRRFGPYAARVLLHRELELNALLGKLDSLDKEDETKGRKYRLQSIEHEEEWDTAQQDLIQELEERLSAYCERRHFGGYPFLNRFPTDHN